ncbi:protein kinase domain-containing protein [uncultured Chloroflexus sp.]|uniref:serine/threonine-protein kinase n=1 Tax=uncultured Chloroflexus sp. TaxID=214040 RepID=UPI002627139D|nr:serine/threonine-protein kinase [uncultured Chloroflexus sp.]
MSDVSLVGQTIGRFEILSELGRGGMAVVYKARQTDLDRIVALKILPPSLTSDQSYIARFRQEARSAARLEHPHIMPIYEVGEVAGYHYIAMKFIQGRTLKQLLEQEGALPITRAAQILAQVGEALDYAHRQGIIHRDIKPSNVMITDDGWIYLTDFGLARGTGSSAGGLTMAGTVMGTPEYMSPEQAQGLPNVGPATDIYALGVMLYELLTGAFPFKAETPMAMLAARLVHAPIPPRDVRGDLPPAVEDVIMRALARKPEARFASAAEMVAALRQAVGMSENELSRPLTPQRGMPAAASDAPNWLSPAQAGPPPPAYGTPPTPSPVYVQAPVAQPYSVAPTVPANPLNAPTVPAPATRKGAPVGIIAGVIIVLLLIGGGIAAFVFSRPAEPEPVASKAEPLIADGDVALARTGGLTDAISAYRSAIAADTNNMTAHARLAGALLAQGRWEDAIAATEPLLAARNPQAQALGYSISGYAYFQLGDIVNARISGAEAIATDDSVALGYALYAAALASNAENSRDNSLMNDAFTAIGNAEDRLNAADPLNRAFARALIGWAFGQDFRLRNDPNVLEQAITSLEAAIDSYPTLAFFHYELGAIYLAANDDTESARAEFNSALELDPNFSPAQAGLGWVAYLDGRTREARQAFNEALQLNPNESLALLGLGRLALDDNQWDEAINYFQQAIDSNPRSATAYGYLGEAKLFTGFNSTDQVTQDTFYQEAEEAYRQSIRLDDYFVLAHNGLGWVLQYQERYSESIEAFERARQIDNQEEEIFNGLGWSLFLSNRYVEAEPMFKRAVELDPTYASAYFGLGRSYEEQGRRAEALAAFQATKRLNPNYRGIDEAIARVSN